MKKSVLLSLLVILLLFSLPLSVFNTSSAEDSYVPSDFSSIQSAINNATDGDTVYISSGTYKEHITINKSISLVGDGASSVAVDGEGYFRVIDIAADNVSIEGITIRNSSSEGHGVYASGVRDITIKDSIVSGTGTGLLFSGVNSSVVRNNQINNNVMYGVNMDECSGNNVVGNTISENGQYGLYLNGCFDNQLYHNNLLNSNNSYDDGENSWDASYPFGGNYWSDHVGTDENGGLLQNISGPDGIVDTPYENISGGVMVDEYPLANQWPFPDIYDPVVSLKSPTNNSRFSSGPIDLQVWDLNLDEVHYSVNGSALIRLNAPYDIGTTDLPEGEVTFKLVAWDTNGNYANKTYRFFKDSTPPQITLNELENGSVIQSGEVISFSIHDKNLTEVTFTVDNENYEVSEPYELATGDWDEGEHVVVVTAVDNLGHTTEKRYHFTVDDTLPSIEISPRSGSKLLPGSTIDINITDENLASVNYTVNRIEYQGNESFSIDTSEWVDGSYNITVNALDLADNLRKETYLFEIDSDPSVKVTGRILDTFGDGVPGATVTFSKEGQLIDEVETDDDGYFETELFMGNITMTVEKGGEVLIDEGIIEIDDPESVDLGDINTNWQPEEGEPADDWTPYLLIIVIVALGGIFFAWRITRPCEVEEEPTEEPEETHEEITPVIASGTSEEKGPPCSDIVDRHDEYGQKLNESRREVEEAEEAVREAEEKVEEAEKELEQKEEELDRVESDLDAAQEEYEDTGAEALEEITRKAEETVQQLEDSLQDIRDNLPESDAISYEPKPGWTEAGVGYSDMLPVQGIWYRDEEVMEEHWDQLDELHEEYKGIKKKLEEAKRAKEGVESELRELSQEIRDAERGLSEAEERFEEMEEEVDRADDELDAAEDELEEREDELEAKRRAYEDWRNLVETRNEEMSDCIECLYDVRSLLSEIERLRDKYAALKAGQGISEMESKLNGLDTKATWDNWWDSFKRFREKARTLKEIKGFTDAELPDEFSGLWDWGGPVGTAVGYGAEEIAGAVIPTDAVKAVGEMYSVFQSLYDPDTALGSRVLAEYLGVDDAARAQEGFNEFPSVLRDAVGSAGELQKMVQLEKDIEGSFGDWRECLDELPPVPDEPEVDVDDLCLEQCRDAREKLEEMLTRLEELIERAENCEPDEIREMMDEIKGIQRGMKNMVARMNRTKRQLELYIIGYRAYNKSKGCFISTAVYGSSTMEELDVLRKFRDDVLLDSKLGRLLVSHYYRTSPSIAAELVEDERSKKRVAGTVDLALRLIEKRRGKEHGRWLYTWISVLVYVFGCLQAWFLTRWDR